MDLLSQVPDLSSDEETKGFDREAGNRWIYPENLPVRKYQFSIVKTALFNNTLVCLPTGLGKTFIAAVVMYNYFRWYPKGLIVFLAPTKPLVAQQIDACHDIMGIPISDTVELTGATNQTKRATAWRNHRVIFATPQTFQKDLERSIVPTELVKCIVIDEAHKALGKHAYCESIRMMHQQNPHFRLLALSATPGSKLEAVQDVIRNLYITHLELRDDTSPDITPYINERKIEVILVDLGQDLSQFKERYIEIMDRHVKILLQYNVLKASAAHISKGRIFYILNEFKSRPNKSYNHGIIMKTLNILLTMYHAYELIIRHGLRAFIHFYDNHSDKFWLDNEPALQDLLENIKQYLGPFPEVKSFMDGSVVDVPGNLVFGHGKFKTLQNLLIQHFRQANNTENSTRAIVFTEYRDIVNELYILLLQSRPLIRPQVFVGQAGLKQKQQKKALEDFRSNQVNVLISTSVGEEGLDVGEVDLIVCFDISQHSPTRLVQRMGRTGRKRNGHIIILVTDGKEHQTLRTALAKRDSMNNKVLHSSGVIEALHNSSPRMIPEDVQPEVQKIHMTVLPKAPPQKKGRKKKPQVETEKKARGRGKSKNPKSAGGPGRCGEQSGSLMRFLTAAPNDLDEIDGDIVAPKIHETRIPQILSSQPLRPDSTSLEAIKSADVKLLTDDNETIEFLTLCATRQSEKFNINNNNDENQENRHLVIPYAPQVRNCGDDFLDNLRIIDDGMLDCLKGIKMFVKPVDNELTQITPGVVIPGDVGHYHSPEAFMDCGNNFEDLLNTSESDMEDNCDRRESPPVESVDWSHKGESKKDETAPRNLEVKVVVKSNFEGLLDDSSDEEIMRSPEVVNQNCKTLARSGKSQETSRSPECYAECAFENILDEPSDEDLDATQFDFNSLATGVKNPEAGVGGIEEVETREENVENMIEDTVGMEVTGAMVGTIPCPEVLPSKNPEMSVSQFSNHSATRKPQIQNENLLDDEVEVISGGQSPSLLALPSTRDDKKIGDRNCSPWTSTRMKRISQEVNSSDEESGMSKNSLGKGHSSAVKDNLETNYDKGIDSLAAPSKKSQYLCDKTDTPTPQNKLQMNFHSTMAEDKSRIDVDEPNLMDLDDFEPWEDIEKVETMPQVSIPSESVIPQSSTNPTNLANKKWPSHPLKLPSQKREKRVSQCQGRSNGHTSLRSPIRSDDNPGRDAVKVSTIKNQPHRTLLHKLLKHSKTPAKSSDQNKSNAFASTSSTSSGKEPSAIPVDDLDDFDWDSDFDTPPAVTNAESRFFKETSKLPTKISESTGSSGEFSSSKYFNKTRDKTAGKSHQDSALNNDKLAAIRATLFSKPSREFITQQNSDSDDDFATTKITKTAFNGCQAKSTKKSVKTSDQESKIPSKAPPKIVSATDRSACASSASNFAVPTTIPPKMKRKERGQSTSSSKKQRMPTASRRGRIKSDFIDDEAEESDDCHEETDDSSEDDGKDLDSFVSHTQIDDSVDMKAFYLRSTKSPKKRMGFHLARPKTPPPDVQIYSQTVEPDTYMYDSFCVSASQEESICDDSDAEITILEEIDDNSRRKRKRGDSIDSKTKRRRIQTVEDISSDDETEGLRAAILEESMMLKQQR